MDILGTETFVNELEDLEYDNDLSKVQRSYKYSIIYGKYILKLSLFSVIVGVISKTISKLVDLGFKKIFHTTI